MISKILIFLWILLAAAPPPPPADDFPKDLERWYVTAPPEPYSEQFWAAHHDTKHEWVVTSSKNSVQVGIRGRQEENQPPLPFKIDRTSSKDGLSRERTTAKVNDGWIIGFNAGEFGAGLWWFSPDGKNRY